MSGIYIHGMEMPQGDEVITVFPDGTAHRRHLGLNLHLSESKAIPVPEHGRLIDADALCEGRVNNDNVVICAKCAPTIIPAERREKND